MERQQDYVLRTVEERAVRLMYLWFTDVLGQLKSIAITPAELENAFEEGMSFDGSAVDGFTRAPRHRVVLRPDDGGRRRRPAQEDGAQPRGDGDPRALQPPRGRTQPARDRPALHGRADDGRQRHDLQAGREGGRARARPLRDV